MHGVPHAARLGALPAPVDLVELRLPRAVRGAVGAGRRTVRDRARPRPDGRHGPHRPRRPHRAADRRRARLAPGARRRPERAAARGAHLARARGPPARRSRHRPRRVDRPLGRPLRVRVVGAGRRRARIGVGSYEPRHHVKEPTREMARRLDSEAVRYQGNWFPHQLRPAAADGVFFVGDSAGHCIPLSGEGIRTAFHFGIAAGRELRAVLAGEKRREQALTAYGAFSDAHAPFFRRALRLQRLIPALPPRALTALLAVMGRERPCRRAFTWYLDQAHPGLAATSWRQRADPCRLHARATRPMRPATWLTSILCGAARTAVLPANAAADPVTAVRSRASCGWVACGELRPGMAVGELRLGRGAAKPPTRPVRERQRPARLWISTTRPANRAHDRAGFAADTARGGRSELCTSRFGRVFLSRPDWVSFCDTRAGQHRIGESHNAPSPGHGAGGPAARAARSLPHPAASWPALPPPHGFAARPASSSADPPRTLTDLRCARSRTPLHDHHPRPRNPIVYGP